MPRNKIKHLVVDTSAFIKCAALQDIADEVITVQEVIDEVTSKRQLRKLVVLPYELRVKDVFTENIKVITDFSKKTGDYTSLSATDIKVIALTYQMEKELVGVNHLKTEPTTQRTVKVTGLRREAKGDPDENETDEESAQARKETHQHTRTDSIQEDFEKDNKEISQSDPNTDKINEGSSAGEALQQYLSEKLSSVDLKTDCVNIEEQKGSTDTQDRNGSEKVDNLLENCLVPEDDADEYDEDESDDSGDDGSDNGEWITPTNIQEKKKEMENGEGLEYKSAEVACITTDFAMQNVLKQIGLNVTAIDGRLIRHVRTFIFRCTTCFKTTSVMTKAFCPKCGHATLKKVSISVDEHGNQQIHINGRKPLSARGKRFSLPTPKGGQHFQYPVLTEDQHVHHRRATRLAQKKNNPLDPDYIAGYSPFTMRDVNSKSAVLGIRNDKQDMKQWMRKSANDVRRKKM